MTDISERTRDPVVIVWSTPLEEGVVRDRILRAVLARLPPVPLPP